MKRKVSMIIKDKIANSIERRITNRFRVNRWVGGYVALLKYNDL